MISQIRSSFPSSYSLGGQLVNLEEKKNTQTTYYFFRSRRSVITRCNLRIHWLRPSLYTISLVPLKIMLDFLILLSNSLYCRTPFIQ